MPQAIRLEFVDDNREVQLINERLQAYEDQLVVLRIDKLEGNIIPTAGAPEQHPATTHFVGNVQPNPTTGALGVPAPRFTEEQLDAEIERLEGKIKALRSRRDELTNTNKSGS